MPAATRSRSGRDPLNPPPLPGAPPPSNRRILPAVLLAGIVGFLGLHRLYAGRYLTGVAQLILCVAGAMLLGKDLAGITALRTMEDIQDWALQHQVRPLPVLLIAIPVFWAIFDCFALLAGRFIDGAGRRMSRWW